MRTLLVEAAGVAAVAQPASTLAGAVAAVLVCAACVAALAAVCGLCGGGGGASEPTQADSSAAGTHNGYRPPPPERPQTHRNGHHGPVPVAEPEPHSHGPGGDGADERRGPEAPKHNYPRDALVVREQDAAGLAEFLLQAHKVTRGALPPKCRMEVATIVPGTNATRVNIKDVYGIDATALFFAPSEKCRQHLRVHHKCSQFAPVLRQNENAPATANTLTRTDDSEVGGSTNDGANARPARRRPIERFLFPEVEHRLPTTSTSVVVPAHIRLERCTSLVEELRRHDSATAPPHRSAAAASAALQQLFQVVLQLNAFLRHAHENEYVMRDITIGNVVFAQLQAQRGWTLLEYTKACRKGKRSQSVTAHTSPPEMARLVRTGGDVPLASSFDMWQLGMLVYQLASQPWPYARPYWPEAGTSGAYTDAQILQALEHYHARDDDGGAAGREHLLLPHEAKPLQNDTLRQIVEKLLTPAPEARWTSEDLRVHLELNTTSLTMRGLPQAPPLAPPWPSPRGVRGEEPREVRALPVA